MCAASMHRFLDSRLRGNDPRGRGRKILKPHDGVNATHAAVRLAERIAAFLGYKSGSHPDRALAGTVEPNEVSPAELVDLR